MHLKSEFWGMTVVVAMAIGMGCGSASSSAKSEGDTAGASGDGDAGGPAKPEGDGGAASSIWDFTSSGGRDGGATGEGGATSNRGRGGSTTDTSSAGMAGWYCILDGESCEEDPCCHSDCVDGICGEVGGAPPATGGAAGEAGSAGSSAGEAAAGASGAVGTGGTSKGGTSSTTGKGGASGVGGHGGATEAGGSTTTGGSGGAVACQTADECTECELGAECIDNECRCLVSCGDLTVVESPTYCAEPGIFYLSICVNVGMVAGVICESDCQFDPGDCLPPPSGWTCPLGWYNEHEYLNSSYTVYCDCGCGSEDPDCLVEEDDRIVLDGAYCWSACEEDEFTEKLPACGVAITADACNEGECTGG